MQTDNPLLDDLARVVTGAVGVAAGARREVEAAVRQRIAALLADTTLVSREDFEAVEAMAIRAREEQERLEKRVRALEAALAGKKPAARAAASRGGARKTRARPGPAPKRPKAAPAKPKKDQ